ncbi:MAG: three-Cys-motif partner protein TcmP [Rhodospirillaceae bacterium]|nr:three-Cys-motif partner protein TcmP [Rhodospirillaceae bacterium]
MVTKPYDWSGGATLDEHTKRKHKILREYFFQYITVRCQLPQQSKFRLAVVDGFAGGGRYSCGTGGSPIILLEEINKSLEKINLERASEGLGLIEIECLFIFNDADKNVVGLLKENCAPLLAAIKIERPQLHVHVEYLEDTFEASYPRIKALISTGRYRSILYNLDQCGHSKVDTATLIDIMGSAPSVEVFYTFMISSLISFLSKTNTELLEQQLSPFGLKSSDIHAADGKISKNEFLGAAEKLVFGFFKGCAKFVSPFSIRNPDGWRYWLIHFANNYRARQVYNDILHDNSTSQAHFGRSGLNMLAYDPSQEGALYLFDVDGRNDAKKQLLNDIPHLLEEAGDAIGVRDFYESTYNATPSHKDDIHAAIIENPDIEVVTPTGGLRRKANTIDVEDILRLKHQRSFPLYIPSKPYRK